MSDPNLNDLEEIGWDELGFPLAIGAIIVVCVIIAFGVWIASWLGLL